MGIFSSFDFAWDGADYSIPSDRIMGAIATVEDCMTMAEIHEMLSSPRKLKVARVARVWGELLRYAGAPVTDEQVYAGMFGGAKDQASRVVVSLYSLLKLMVPESAVSEQGNPPRQARPVATGLPKKRSKRPAARARRAGSA
jgi:hypothetical protein